MLLVIAIFGVGTAIAVKAGINLDPKTYTSVITAAEPFSNEK